MSNFLKLQYGFYPHIFSPDNEDGGNGGGSDGDNNDGDQGDEGDTGDKHDVENKDRIINKEDIFGDDKKPEGEDDKKDEDDKKAERPDHMPEKFWDPEKGEPRTEAMAKAYKDLESKLGNKSKAPEEYKIELSESAQKLWNEETAESDPMLKWFKGYAKENNFSQEMFNSALDGFAESGSGFMEDTAVQAPDPKVEMEKLGKNADAIVKNQIEFMGSLFKTGAINEEQAEELMILTETAAGINAIQAIREHYGEKQNIPLNLKGGSGIKSADELRHMQADDRYGNDQEYTNTVDEAYEAKYGKGQSGQSRQSSL